MMKQMKLPKNYEPQAYEKDIYALWEKSRAFQPKGSGSPYTIVMPPPNANANMHLGYELTIAIEDIAARYHRLKGDATLLLPGADHAGFETQSVYEKQLAKEGKSRFDFNRDELYQQIWDFVALNKGNFEQQMRAAGVSADWSRYTFTLDPKIVKQAYKTFKKMWDEGLIYRGERLVNYCTFHGTAFADIEVVHKEEQGKIWQLRYPLTDGTGEIIVATTRPETLFGDVAVAVHPEDDRYKDLIGKTAKLPLSNRELPIITDEFVDRAFGTGAVKITPAHDPNDYEVGERHNLPKVTVIDGEGNMTEVPERYRGLSITAARELVVKDLAEQGTIAQTEDHTHSVGHCYKCDTVIQPLLRDQWFVNMKPLAKRAIKELQANKITFYPETKQEQLIRYLEGLRDWNISRQIAWGIPIPAFQNVDHPDDWIFDERVDQEEIEVDGHTYRRDPDTFDTWFSSSSWPYATLGLETDDFKKFYPNSLMETGGEILYPWVSRMLMLGLYIADEVPFREVYIHGYVMAEDGSKMSKSVGNVIDPMPIIEKHGSDALRMGIIAGRAPAVNRGYDPRRVEEARNFANKLWNVARFIEHLTGDNFKPAKPHAESVADHWILCKLQHTTNELSGDLDSYRISEAYEKLYHFIWDDVADWYIEASKAAPNTQLLAYVLESALTLMHPFAPFVTETIWQALGWREELLVTYHWPEVSEADNKKVAAFEEIKTIVTETRYVTGALKVQKATLGFVDAPLIAENANLIERLARLGKVQGGAGEGGIRLTQTSLNAWLDIDEATAKAYADELNNKKLAQEQVIERLNQRLNNKSYVANAPKKLVEETKDQLTEAEALLQNIIQEIDRFTATP